MFLLLQRQVKKDKFNTIFEIKLQAGPGKPNVFIEAGIHAREWISPAVATFIFRELVEDNAEHPEYLDNINWYFLPSANPDGYAYTFDTDRLWRKTRSPQSGGCYGVDPNRNWDFHWGGSLCSEFHTNIESNELQKLVSVLILALKSSLENNLSLRLRQATFVTL